MRKVNSESAGRDGVAALVDRFGRPVDRLRISLTLRCNHSCIFCHREGIGGGVGGRELGWRDWAFVAEVASRLGIRYVKLTGGEPLVREDIVEVVAAMSERLEEVSMVTNASLLKPLAGRLAEAGLSRINVSLHSLREDTFRTITGGSLSRVLAGIRAALDAGLRIKVNYLVLKQNAGEFEDILGYAASIGADVNVIELIPLGTAGPEYGRLHARLDRIEEWLSRRAVRFWESSFQGRPTYELPEGIRVYLIKGFGNPALCARCSRLRMTPEGFIQTCIYRPDQVVDAREAIVGRDAEGLAEAFAKATSLREPYFRLGSGRNPYYSTERRLNRVPR